VKTKKKESKPAAEENGADAASNGTTSHEQAQDEAVQRMVARFTTKCT